VAENETSYGRQIVMTLIPRRPRTWEISTGRFGKETAESRWSPWGDEQGVADSGRGGGVNTARVEPKPLRASAATVFE
jgi:hypothetical protein